MCGCTKNDQCVGCWAEEQDAIDRHPAGKGLTAVPDMTEDFKDFEAAVWRVAEENIAMLLSKHRDYGPKNIAQAPGGALNGLRVRMHDKLARINHLIDSGVDPENESLYDSFLDLANYAVIAQLVLNEEWPQ